MSDVITLPTLPIAFGIATLLLAGYYQTRSIKAPLWLMMACLITSLVFAGSKHVIAPHAMNGIVAALIGMVSGGVLMIPLHYLFDMGKGAIAALAAFGSWICCAIGVSMGGRVLLITAACAFVVLTANVFVHKRLPDSDPESEEPVPHGQLPISFGALVGLLSTIYF